MRSCLLFYNLDVAKRPRRAATRTRVEIRRAARRGGAGFIARDTGNSNLAVAQRLARVVRDDEDAGSSPAGETNDSSVAQRMTERAARNREVKGSIPSRGAN